MMIIGRFESSDSIVAVTHVGVPGVSFGTGWFYCAACVDTKTYSQKGRLGLGDKFCRNCGAELTWPPRDEPAAVNKEDDPVMFEKAAAFARAETVLRGILHRRRKEPEDNA